jgi:Asp-tRNA(Asn)/Glu-tRNA(Gln) amidotransferase A subunit family amidase
MFRAHASEYGREIRALVEAGLARPAPAYVRAQRARLAFREEVVGLLQAYDALLVPTAPAPAPAGLASTGDASCCAPWTYAGVPAITLPSGLAPSGLPYGVQLVHAGSSARLLGVARWCERVLGFQAVPPD